MRGDSHRATDKQAAARGWQVSTGLRGTAGFFAKKFEPIAPAS